MEKIESQSVVKLIADEIAQRILEIQEKNNEEILKEIKASMNNMNVNEEFDYAGLSYLSKITGWSKTTCRSYISNGKIPAITQSTNSRYINKELIPVISRCPLRISKAASKKWISSGRPTLEELRNIAIEQRIDKEFIGRVG
ncbi:MAG: hypothetical protein COC01_00200 [Bacteroidetes bacterium]|nr:MAG: hypothetical protein COC01_00200 [Bacteroidota bacterium]